MVVDDEPAVRQLTARILREAGYATVELADGQDAWNYLRRAGVPVHAIISDVVMPRLTGTELVARLFDSRPALPIILMSAYSTDELRTRCLDHSPVPLLTKPFSNEQLVAMVRSVLEPRNRQAY
jgi:two-component system cell cycle sensor histidine kinase/response regulator CckA